MERGMQWFKSPAFGGCSPWREIRNFKTIAQVAAIFENIPAYLSAHEKKIILKEETEDFSEKGGKGVHRTSPFRRMN